MTKNDLPKKPHNHQLRKNPLPPIEWLKSKFRYNPETGTITGPRKTPLGQNLNGYLIIKVKFEGKPTNLRAHRLAFVLMQGRWPHLINHKDGCRDNNAWENLEETNQSHNMREAQKGRNYQKIGPHWLKHDGTGNLARFARFCDFANYIKELHEWQDAGEPDEPPKPTKGRTIRATPARLRYLESVRATTRQATIGETAPQPLWQQVPLI